jgi:hypothetical protein
LIDIIFTSIFKGISDLCLSSSPGRVKNFLHAVQTGSGAHPASYPMGTGGAFPGVEAVGTWSWSLTSN